MDINKIAQYIPTGRSVDHGEIILAARQVQPSFSDKSIYWLLNQLKEAGLIERVGRNKYFLIKEDRIRQDYTYESSEKMKQVISKLSVEFPLMEFQAWESIQFNYFLNHQIAHNTLFVEVEPFLENSVYEYLRDEFSGNMRKVKLEAYAYLVEGVNLLGLASIEL